MKTESKAVDPHTEIKSDYSYNALSIFKVNSSPNAVETGIIKTRNNIPK